MEGDAKFFIWAGYKFKNESGLGKFLDKNIPQDKIDEYCEFEISRSDIDVIWSNDEICGMGIVIFKHDWKGGVTELNLKRITKKMVWAMKEMKKHAKKWNFNEKVKVWSQADFS